MIRKPSNDTARLLRWRDVYREAELYKAAIRVYTKPLFLWRKALNVSTDGKTLYDLAARGLNGLAAIHEQLRSEQFHFRPSVDSNTTLTASAGRSTFLPGGERIVDLLIYRLLNRRLHHCFSTSSYAYRDHTYGLDRCQSRIRAVLRSIQFPVYLVKRDISDYFASVDHEILLRQLQIHIAPDDYLFDLISERIRFDYQDETGLHRAAMGIPFGCASACVFANVYLTGLDHEIESVPDVHYFRYADDMLLLSSSREAALLAKDRMLDGLNKLRLTTKASHQADLLLTDLVLTEMPASSDSRFHPAMAFRHLGLQFECGERCHCRATSSGRSEPVPLCFRRARRRWKKIGDPRGTRTLVAIACETIERGVRNVAILDYYLKHVTDGDQLRLLDRWLAEEILSLVFGGHKQGHFAKISYQELREYGLPSLVHRQRLILHRKIGSPFLSGSNKKQTERSRGRLPVGGVFHSMPPTSLCAQKQRLTSP